MLKHCTNFLWKKSPRHIDPKIPSHGPPPPGPGCHHPRTLNIIYNNMLRFFLLCWGCFLIVFHETEVSEWNLLASCLQPNPDTSETGSRSVHETVVSEWTLLTWCLQCNPDTLMQSLALWHFAHHHHSFRSPPLLSSMFGELIVIYDLDHLLKKIVDSTYDHPYIIYTYIPAPSFRGANSTLQDVEFSTQFHGSVPIFFSVETSRWIHNGKEKPVEDDIPSSSKPSAIFDPIFAIFCG